MLCVTFLVLLSAAVGYDPPERLYPEWAVSLMHMHIINMTLELVKDTTIKLKHAEKIQEEYKHSITYELGTIAAGILERFKYMLRIYRKYANLNDVARITYGTDEYLTGYQHIQGAYNEITLEKNMFFYILKTYDGSTKKQKLESKFKDLIAAAKRPKTTPPKPKRRNANNKWGLPEDILDNY